MNNYYTTLFSVFRSLLSERDCRKLDVMISDFHEFISDELNPMTLQELELRMANNNDLLAGLEVRGQLLTQFQIQNRLNEIVNWLTERLYAYMYHIRFTSNIKVE